MEKRIIIFGKAESQKELLHDLSGLQTAKKEGIFGRIASFFKRIFR